MQVTSLATQLWSNPWVRTGAITLVASLLKAVAEEMKVVESPMGHILLDMLINMRLVLLASPFAKYILKPEGQ